MYFSITLILVAAAMAGIDWFTAAPEDGEAEWPRYAKLAGASLVGAIGLINAFEGWWRWRLGRRAYQSGDYLRAIDHLAKVEGTPFTRREALDYLALSWKKRAEVAEIPLVKETNYAHAIELLVQSINRYPNAPFAHNNLINIFRRNARWEEAENALRQLINKARAGDFRSGDKPLPEKDHASLFVTAGNFWVDDANPKFSLDKALELYREAGRYDETNRFLILNYPARLMRKAETAETLKERLALWREAYEISSREIDWIEAEDEVFALINLIDVLAEPEFEVDDWRGSLEIAAAKLEEKRSQANVDDEAWLVLAKAYRRLNLMNDFDRAIARAEVERENLNEIQVGWLDGFIEWRRDQAADRQ